MRNTIYLLLTSILILSACAEEEHWDSIAPGHDAGDFSFLLAHEEYAEPRSAESLTGESQPGAASLRQTLSNYDRVEFVVVDEAGDKVSGVKGLYDKNTSNMRLEGLHAGAYRILILGMKGDPAADQATIHPINHISEVWLSFPEGLAKPLDGEYFYSATPFTVREVSTASGHEVIAEIPERIVQRRIVGRMDFTFSYNNPYIRTAVTSNTVTLNSNSRFYTQLSGEGLYSGASNGEMKVLDLSEQTEYLFMPTIQGGSVTGDATLLTRDYRGSATRRSYTFELDSVTGNHIGQVEIQVVHPDDRPGVCRGATRPHSARRRTACHLHG